jgi:hypothetical protein
MAIDIDNVIEQCVADFGAQKQFPPDVNRLGGAMPREVARYRNSRTPVAGGPPTTNPDQHRRTDVVP